MDLDKHLATQVRFLAEMVEADLDGDQLAGRLLRSADYRVQLNRIINRLRENDGHLSNDRLRGSWGDFGGGGGGGSRWQRCRWVVARAALTGDQ